MHFVLMSMKDDREQTVIDGDGGKTEGLFIIP